MIQNNLEQVETALSRVPVFAALDLKQRLSLAANARRQRFRSEEIIFSFGDPGYALYIIVSGMVKITLPSEDGGEALLAILMPGEFFGELSLFDGQPRSASAVAMAATDTIVLRQEEFLSFIKENPNVFLPILSVLSSRLRSADGVFADSIFLEIPALVAKKLVELADSFGRKVGESIEVDFPFTQQELADMIGTTRESVNRALSLLEQNGVIKRDRQTITILNPKLLTKTTSF